MDQVQLRPVSVGRNQGSTTQIQLAGGGYLPGIMYRVKCATAIVVGTVVGIANDGRRLRINPWVINEQTPIVDLELSVSTVMSSGPAILGVALENCAVGKEVLIAGPGSIVAVKCQSVTNDAPLQNIGQPVIVQPGGAGAVMSSSDIVGDIGSVVGVVVVPAGTHPTTGQGTGDNTWVGIKVETFF